VSGQLHAPVALPTGKLSTVIVWWEAWASEPVWTHVAAPVANLRSFLQPVVCSEFTRNGWWQCLLCSCERCSRHIDICAPVA